MELQIALMEVMKMSQLAKIAQNIDQSNANTMMDINLSLTTLQNALPKKVKTKTNAQIICLCIGTYSLRLS